MQPSSFNVPNQPVPPAPPVAGVDPALAVPQPPVAIQQPLQVNPEQNAPVAPASNQAPDLADDGDLIEKEWVIKVKQIVHATANDPYEQNLQLTRLKADYMQKRYGKQVKVED